MLWVTFIEFILRGIPQAFVIIWGVYVILAIAMACAVIIVGIPILKSIYGIVVMTLMLVVGEFLNIMVLSIFNINMNIDFKTIST